MKTCLSLSVPNGLALLDTGCSQNLSVLTYVDAGGQARHPKTGHMIAVPQASNISALGGMSAKISHSVQHRHATNANYFCFYRALKLDELK